MADDKLKRFEMLAPAGWFEAVDRWRGTQPGIPSRGEAIRSIVGRYLGWPPEPEEDEDDRRDREAAERAADDTRNPATGY
jgi:hypothetical protein